MLGNEEYSCRQGGVGVVVVIVVVGGLWKQYPTTILMSGRGVEGRV